MSVFVHFVEVGGGLSLVGCTCALSSSLALNTMTNRGGPTGIRNVLQPGISNKTHSGMEPLCIPLCMYNHSHLLAPQLRLYALQRPLEAQPEADLLRCHAGGNVSHDVGHRLDRFDPCVALQRELINVL